MTQIPLQSRFKQDFTRLRFAEGSYVSGRYVDGSVTAANFKGSVQPFKDSGSELLQRLREGDRTKKLIVIYTYPSTLRTSSEKPTNTPADVVIYEGEAYEIQKTNIWKGQILTHDEVWGVEYDAAQLYSGEVPADESHVATNGTTVRIYGIGNYLLGNPEDTIILYVNDEAVVVSGEVISGSYLDYVQVTSSQTIYDTDTVTFDYDGTLTSVVSGETTAVEDGAVGNRSTQEAPVAGYPLDDDGTVASQFGYGTLSTTAPDYVLAEYTYTENATGALALATPNSANVFSPPQMLTVTADDILSVEAEIVGISAAFFDPLTLGILHSVNGTPAGATSVYVANDEFGGNILGGTGVYASERTAPITSFRIGIDLIGPTGQIRIKSSDGIQLSLTTFTPPLTATIYLSVQDSGTTTAGETVSMRLIVPSDDYTLACPVGAKNLLGDVIP